MLEGEVLSHRSPQTFFRYDVEDLLVETLVDESTCRYHSLIAETVVRPPRLPVRIDPESVPPPAFNPPATETLQWSVVLPWMAGPEQAVVRVVLDQHLWKDKVLLPEAFTQANHCDKRVRPPFLPEALQQELILAGYIQVNSSSPIHGCPVFAVVRPDGKLRLIWDGRMLNHLCHPPPSFSFVPLTEQLRNLLDPSVAGFVVFDYTSWFCQLRCHSYVRRWFGTRLGGGRKGLLAGLPMGFAWAPIIAQLTSEAILQEILRRVRAAGHDCVGYVYVDNTILAVRNCEPSVLAEALKAITALVVSVCGEAGTVIKASSFISGSLVEWIGLELDASCRAKPPLSRRLKGFTNVFSLAPRMPSDPGLRFFRLAFTHGGPPSALSGSFFSYCSGCLPWDVKAIRIGMPWSHSPRLADVPYRLRWQIS